MLNHDGMTGYDTIFYVTPIRYIFIYKFIVKAVMSRHIVMLNNINML